MKKILAVILSLLVLSPIFASTVSAAFEFPENTPLVIRQNAERLYMELTSFRNELLESGIELPLMVVGQEISMWSAFGSAEKIDSFGARRIAEVQIQLGNYGAFRADYFIVVTDEHGNSFFAHLNENGSVGFLWAGTDDQGELLWFYDWGHIGPPMPVACWYTRLPRFLHWLFRWVFFGWAWMCC